MVQRSRSTNAEGLPPETLRSHWLQQRELSGFEVEGSDLEGDRWLQRWRTIEPVSEGLHQIGVTVYHARDGHLYTISYGTDQSSPTDEAAEERRSQWESRLRRLN